MAITLAPQQITPEQAKWLERESKRTGNSKASIVRSLIQDKIAKGKR